MIKKYNLCNLTFKDYDPESEWCKYEDVKDYDDMKKEIEDRADTEQSLSKD